jgi:UDP-N-acetylmuramyl pentapeptide synthase
MKNIFKKIIFKILEWEARALLRRKKPKIIAITGSVGKTTTKDMVHTVLSSTYQTGKNPKSYNSEIGVPLAILGLSNAWNSAFGWISNIYSGLARLLTLNFNASIFPKWFVLEIGADHPGDIKKICKWLKPEIGIVTGLGSEIPVHVAFFSSIEQLVREKAELLISLPKEGIAILNIDDARVWDMRGLTRASIATFGFDQSADVHGTNLKTIYEDNKPAGISFRVDHDGKSIPVRLMGVLGKGQAYAALAAITAGAMTDINHIKIIEALNMHPPAPGRMRILQGIESSVLIDDTYNSSPAAVRIALDVLHNLEIDEGGRKIAVLGDMMELGQYEELEHKKVGEWLRGVADVIVCVGERARIIGNSALADGCEKRQVYFFTTSVEAGEFLRTYVGEKDVVLLKASQSIRLEKATEILLADPTKAESILVRQEKDWKKKK